MQLARHTGSPTRTSTLVTSANESSHRASPFTTAAPVARECVTTAPKSDGPCRPVAGTTRWGSATAATRRLANCSSFSELELGPDGVLFKNKNRGVNFIVFFFFKVVLFFFFFYISSLCTSLGLLFLPYHVYISHCEQKKSAGVRLKRDANPPVFSDCIVECLCLSAGKFHHNLSITTKLWCQLDNPTSWYLSTVSMLLYFWATCVHLMLHWRSLFKEHYAVNPPWNDSCTAGNVSVVECQFS